MDRKHIVIAGATSAMAWHCARLWAGRHDANFTLIGRNADTLKRVADDLKVRDPQASISTKVTDFLDPLAIASLANAITRETKADVVLIAHGSLPDQNHCQTNLTDANHALQINAVSPALFAEAFILPMEQANHGVLAIIGSVAGDRGRQSNYTYGSAKSLIEAYTQGLQHRLASTRVKVVLIKPGPTDTPMTAHLKSQGAKLAPVEQVAAGIVKAIDRGRPVVYLPAKWRLIMAIIRRLPRPVFHRMKI